MNRAEKQSVDGQEGVGGRVAQILRVDDDLKGEKKE